MELIMSYIKGILQLSTSGILMGIDISVKLTLSGEVTLNSLQMLKQLRPNTERQSDFCNWNKNLTSGRKLDSSRE